MTAHADALFDPDDWLEAAAPIPVGTGGMEPDSDELALDEERVLVRDDEDRRSRKVHLHSADKAHYARYYADLVGTGMRRAYGGPLAWVELFAGPGRLYVVEEDQFRPGSPVEALAVRHPFNQYVFCDLDPECVQSLTARVGGKPGVHVLEGDANSAALHDVIAALVPRNALVVLYADPDGLDFDLSTIRYFAERYAHLDLLVNFPVRGVIRALRAGYEEKASRVLGHEAPVELISKRAKSQWGPVRSHVVRAPTEGPRIHRVRDRGHQLPRPPLAPVRPRAREPLGACGRLLPKSHQPQPRRAVHARRLTSGARYSVPGSARSASFI